MVNKEFNPWGVQAAYPAEKEQKSEFKEHGYYKKFGAKGPQF